jgi:hypothetical protein
VPIAEEVSVYSTIVAARVRAPYRRASDGDVEQVLERSAPRFARRFVGQRAREAPRGRLATGAPEENDP